MLSDADRARRAPDANPVVDPVPPTDHRVITTVLADALIGEEANNRPGSRGSQPGDYSERLMGELGENG